VLAERAPEPIANADSDRPARAAPRSLVSVTEIAGAGVEPDRFASAPVQPVNQLTEPHNEPVQLQTQADIAVALTAALTARMKPRATPRRDLRPSTAAWMMLTGLAAVFLLLAVFSKPSYRWMAVAVGVVELVAAQAWITYLVYRREPRRVLLCAVPGGALHFLCQYKYAKYRPLRFAVTGAVIVAVAIVAPVLHASVRSLVHGTDPEPVVASDPAAMSKLEQLRTYRERQAYDPLMNLLEVLAKTDPLLSQDAKDRAELSAELRALCEHVDIGVRRRAMAAYARWDPTGAREVCLRAVGSASAEEREEALKLLPYWKDDDSARAVQLLIGRPGPVETSRAKAALEEIGGPPAEGAAVILLTRASDQATKLTALSILEKVGRPNVAKSLRAYASASDDAAVRARALVAAEAIDARTRISAPEPPP
jgi:hypothetical protein